MLSKYGVFFGHPEDLPEQTLLQFHFVGQNHSEN